MKRFLNLIIGIFACLLYGTAWSAPAEKVIVGYVTSWSDVMPDPALLTHINYAFGHVNETFDGVGISNPDRLRRVVALKTVRPRTQDCSVGRRLGQWPLQRNGLNA